MWDFSVWDFTTPFICCFVAILVMGGVGIVPLRTQSPRFAFIFEILTRLLTVLATLALVYLIEPRTKKLFEDFGTELPYATVIIIKVTDGIAKFPILLVGGFSVLVAEVLVFRNFNNTVQSRNNARLLSGLLTCVTSVIFLGILIVFTLPLIKLLNDLS
ncbi:MAG: hypothetical protein KDA84_04150 [Planctomycetaceae bacterium]|nr:hypothetical protein [Planctomycetaceae bacterium]